MKQFSTQEFKIEDLKPSPYNPRRISAKMAEKLHESLKSFGLVDPLIVNTRNMTVVGGNQRLSVLKEMGLQTVTAVAIDLDEAKEKALNVALNKISGEWDLAKLQTMLEDTPTLADMVTGFDPVEFEMLGQEQQLPPAGEENGEQPPAGPAQQRDQSQSDGSSAAEKAYCVYIAFKTESAAKKWGADRGLDVKFKKGNYTCNARLG